MVTPTNMDKSMIFATDTVTHSAPKILIRIPRTTSQSSSNTLSPAEEVLSPSPTSISTKIDPLPNSSIQHSSNTINPPRIQSNSDWSVAPPLIETANEKTTSVHFDTIHLGCFDYEPFRLYFPPKDCLIGCTFDVLIKRDEFRDGSRNLAVKKRYIFGGENEIYTDDSDVSLILQQQCQVKEKYKTSPFLKAKFMIMGPLGEYSIFEKNGIKSRKWNKQHSGLSIKLISVNGSKGRSRQKNNKLAASLNKYQKEISPMMPVIFSSITRNPLVPITAVLPDNLREQVEQNGSVLLEGKTDEYSIEKSKNSRSRSGSVLFMIVKNGKVIMDNIEWSKIEWNPKGLCINNTFISLRGVHPCK